MGLHLGGAQSMGGHSPVETQSVEDKVLVQVRQELVEVDWM